MATVLNNSRLIPKRLVLPLNRRGIALAAFGVFASPIVWADQVVGHNAKGLQYKVSKGDTLIQISKRITGSDSHWREIAAASGLAKPNFISTNQVLVVPYSIVPTKDIPAQLLSQSGQVEIIPAANSQGTSMLAVGSSITTGATGRVALKLADGTQMNIEPGSTVVLDRLKQYYLPSAVEARIQLEKGAMEVASPGKRSLPLDVRTPRSTAAVRGTQFRVGTEDGNDRAEVLKGVVNYQTPAPAVNLERLTGAALPKNASKPKVEHLLPPAVFTAQHVSTSTVEAELRWQAAQGTSPDAYKIQVTKGSADGAVVSTSTLKQAVLRFESPDDGDYVLRVRPLSAVGIEGQESFQKVTFNARPVAPKFTSTQNDGLLPTEAVRLRWEASAEPGTSVIVQLSDDKEFTTILLEQKVQGNEFPVPSSFRGKRFFFRLSTERAEPVKRGPYGNTYQISW